ncbi:uncharacterized protein MKK02DRAFT_39386 [Dioszegia hungarica]|uniref:Uncharacterized protein n=1 Tax=Dioszegia hungarica TaxID=4972 RepID=A0AA38HED0_9TREE|nr:uncharacterized protein MKK02DRAFT_39386 [Dioszegia hungarica]KAI9639108.1 hypothetical protein MKK02DRAFT_39386 [Dioszegia hungarica]
MSDPIPPSKTTSLKRNFQMHPSLLRYALPLSKFARLPSNAGEQIWVGLIIVGKGEVLSPSGPEGTKPKPTALLVRRTSSEPATAVNCCSDPTVESGPLSSGQSIHVTRDTARLPIFEDGYDLPSLPAEFGTDQTLLEAVDRCAREVTGKGAKEIVRFLGRGDYDLVSPASARSVAEVAETGEKTCAAAAVGRAVRYDFLVKLHQGEMVLPEGTEGKWEGTDESWRVMKRVPAATAAGAGAAVSELEE